MAEVKEHILGRISDINSILAQNRKRLVDLQHRLKESTTKYTGLEVMSDNLKKTLEDREQSIADLTAHVQNLETQLSEKVQIIATKDTTIQQQQQELKHRLDKINTVFYVVGKENDLEQKGIIENQGGFLWGLLGSVTTLGTNFDNEYFQVLDKSQQDQIEIPGTINEIVPQRDTTSYSKVTTDDGHTILKIKDPDSFWRENHLAIVVG
jgi:chromosome segregation ATPase